ncbi:hypothetical protein Tco_1556445 [Tanacetum coccineum]
MCSREACVPDNHKEGSLLRTQEMDQSGGVAQGCRGLTCVGIGRLYDHKSSELVHPAAPSKRQAFPNAHPANPSSVLGGPANHLGSYCSRRPRSPQLLCFPFSIAFLSPSPSPITSLVAGQQHTLSWSSMTTPILTKEVFGEPIGNFANNPFLEDAIEIE